MAHTERDPLAIEDDLDVVRRWNQQPHDDDGALFSDEEAQLILPSGRHMGYPHHSKGRHHGYSGYRERRGRRYHHRRDAYGRYARGHYAGDAIDGVADDFEDPRPHRLAHRDGYYPPERDGRLREKPAGGSFVARYYDDDVDAGIDDADLAGLDLDYRHGRGRQQPGPAGDPYFDNDPHHYQASPAPQAAAVEYAAVNDDDEDMVDYQLPINWQASEFRFRKEVSLDSLEANKVPAVLIDFNDTYKNNKAVQDLLASGAYLGPVSVGGLRAMNAHVSFAVRGESRGNRQLGYGSVPLKEANQYLPNVSRVVHAVIPKRGPKAAAGVDFSLRDTAAVTPTWLSEHPDYTVHTLGKDIKETLTKGVDEISTRHPITQWLIAEGRLPDEDLQDHETVHVDHQDVVDARRAIEAEERNNPKIGDARSLRLVIGRAYAEKRAAGVPRWTDKTEIADDYPIDKRTKALIKQRESAPIVIEGYWKIQHGHPAVVPAMLMDQGEEPADSMVDADVLEELEAYD